MKMKRTMEWISEISGKKIELEIEYTETMQREILWADGWDIEGDMKKTQRGNMILRVDGKEIDRVWNTNFWITIEMKNGLWRIWEIEGVGFSKETAEKIDAFVAECIQAGKDDLALAEDARLAKIEEEEEAKIKEMQDAEEKRKNELLENVATHEIKERIIKDEGGKTSEYVHAIKFANGESYVFRERNIFDFGRVINPKEDGLITFNDGECHVEDFIDGKGWVWQRTIAGQELQAFNLVWEFGRFAKSAIRM